MTPSAMIMKLNQTALVLILGIILVLIGILGIVKAALPMLPEGAKAEMLTTDAGSGAIPVEDAYEMGEGGRSIISRATELVGLTQKLPQHSSLFMARNPAQPVYADVSVLNKNDTYEILPSGSGASAAVHLPVISSVVQLVEDGVDHAKRAVYPVGFKEGLGTGKDNEKDDAVNLMSVDLKDAQSQYRLRDYYIKAAYNCCNAGDFKNDTMDIDALKYVLSRGCRFLDMEVYSVDNQPVVASSSVSSFAYKETFNHLPLLDVIELVGSYAFSNSKCPNPRDPVILHFRFKSRNLTMYKNMAEMMSRSRTLPSRLMGPKHARENHNTDFGETPLKSLMGKIVIMADSTNPVYRSTDMFEFINMASNTMFLQKKTFKGVRDVPDSSAFKETNKKNMCVVLPDQAGKPVNDTPAIAMNSSGVQIVCMCFQVPMRGGQNLKQYEDKFAAVGYAFILKPEELRYVPITIPQPVPVKPTLSYQDRPFKNVAGDSMDM